MRQIGKQTLKVNQWHFERNNLCGLLTIQRKPHHHFGRWQWDSSVWVFVGWQTPALIGAWMMSPIHYTMIKSLLPPTATHTPSTLSHIAVMNQTFIKGLSLHLFIYFCFGRKARTRSLKTERGNLAAPKSSAQKDGNRSRDRSLFFVITIS